MTNTGQCHVKKVYDVPEGTRASKGKSVSSFLRLAEGEKIAAMICVKDFADDPPPGDGDPATASRRRPTSSDYDNATREGGLRGIGLEAEATPWSAAS